MRILIHDYSGHPFQLQLSRWLAAHGHQVLHLYSGDVETPHGATSRKPDDPDDFEVEAISSGRELPKYRLLARWWQERDYGMRLGQRCRDFAPDVVLATGPPAIQDMLRRVAQDGGAGYVCWLQDIYALAVAPVLRQRLGVLLGDLVSAVFRRREEQLVRASDAVVSITADFQSFLAEAGVPETACHVEPNWAPLDELPLEPRDNPWRTAHELEGKTVYLYAGTLGLKHDPAMLSELSKALRDKSEARVVVISQGLGRQFLEERKRSEGLDNLILLDYQPFEELPRILASASVLLALLEPFAGTLSVPSKVLTYLTAGRPVLAAIPSANLATRTILEAGAGLVVAPGDRDGFIAAARRLQESEQLRDELGLAGRRHAEQAFDIDAIGHRFERIFRSVTGAA